MGKIYAAKTNHITNPVGFYMEQIVFSWKVKECEGKKQKNARILISKEKDFSEILFDTKEAELDSCGTKSEFSDSTVYEILLESYRDDRSGRSSRI